jgi:transcription antitermination protein NusB
MGVTSAVPDTQFGQTARRKARKKALDILFEADLRNDTVDNVIARKAEHWESSAVLPDYALTILDGVQNHREAIDDLLRTYAEGWQLERMPGVDRNILRIAIFELMYQPDIPDPVAIDEAVALAKELSTDDSPTFINGLLGRLQLLKGA